MNELDEMTRKVCKGFVNFLLNNKGSSTIDCTATFTREFNDELQDLSKYLNMSNLEVLRWSLIVFMLEVGCVKRNFEGEWVFYASKDEEESTLVLENWVFQPVHDAQVEAGHTPKSLS